MSIEQAIQQREQLARAIRKLRQEPFEEINRLIARSSTRPTALTSSRTPMMNGGDDEPSLGTPDHMVNQSNIYRGGCGWGIVDRELDRSDFEPDKL